MVVYFLFAVVFYVFAIVFFLICRYVFFLKLCFLFFGRVFLFGIVFCDLLLCFPFCSCHFLYYTDDSDRLWWP